MLGACTGYAALYTSDVTGYAQAMQHCTAEGVSSTAGRGDTPRFAAAVVAHPVDAVAPGAKRGELRLDPHPIGHPVLCETFVAVSASLQAAINARPDQQLRRAHRIHLERRHGMKL